MNPVRLKLPTYFQSLGAGVAICSLLCVADAAWSQVTPPLSRGNVTVNQDVLDALGPPPSVPQASPLTPPRRTAQTPTAAATSGKPQSQFFGPPGIGAAAATPNPTPKPPPQRSAASTPSPAPSPAPKPTAAPAPAQTAAAPPPAPASTPAPTAAPTAAPTPAATYTPSPVAATPPATPTPTPVQAEPPPPPTPTIAQGSRQPVGQVPPPAPPPTAKVPEVAPAQTQTASLATPSYPSASPISQTTIPFSPDSSDLTDANKQAVAGIVAKMASSADARLKLSAYASGTPETISQTRRLSLSRALAVRSYLIEQGVKSTRIDVLALGNQVEGGGSADRVDLAVVAP